MAYENINARFEGVTTTATPLTIATIPLTSGQIARVRADMIGKSGNNALFGIKAVAVKNISGTLSLIGSIQDIVPTVPDVAFTGASFTITTSGTDIIIQVTGLAATTINWNLNLSYTII